MGSWLWNETKIRWASAVCYGDDSLIKTSLHYVSAPQFLSSTSSALVYSVLVPKAFLAHNIFYFFFTFYRRLGLAFTHPSIHPQPADFLGTLLTATRTTTPPTYHLSTSWHRISTTMPGIVPRSGRELDETSDLIDDGKQEVSCPRVKRSWPSLNLCSLTHPWRSDPLAIYNLSLPSFALFRWKSFRFPTLAKKTILY